MTELSNGHQTSEWKDLIKLGKQHRPTELMRSQDIENIGRNIVDLNNMCGPRENIAKDIVLKNT